MDGPGGDAERGNKNKHHRTVGKNTLTKHSMDHFSIKIFIKWQQKCTFRSVMGQHDSVIIKNMDELVEVYL